MSVKGAPPPRPLLQMPELCASAFGFAAVSAALVGRQRGQIASDIVDVTYLGVGLLLNAFVNLTYRDEETRPLACDGFASSPTEAARSSVFQVSQSSDGQFFMTYDLRPTGVLLAKQAANMSWLSFLGAAGKGLRAIAADPNMKRKLTGFVPIRSLLRPINQNFAEHYSKYTWSEVSERLHKQGVWHNRVAMPYQMLRYPGASNGSAAGVSRTGDSATVHSPVFLSRQAQILSKL